MDLDALLAHASHRGLEKADQIREGQRRKSLELSEQAGGAFEHGRLHSIRFELFLILHDAKSAWAEETTYLHATFGEPKKLKSKTIVLYDNALPNIMAVLSNDPKSAQGQKGVGMVVVRYYDPR